MQSLLLEKRNDSRKLLKESNLRQGKTLLKDFSWNKQLMKGRDFGGSEQGRYLPALDVYKGRFYRALGMEGINKIRDSPHHVLIISGLYGLVLSDEHIQIYESPMEDFTDIQNIWKRDTAISRVLIDYISRQNITMIVNLASQLSYTGLFDLNFMKGEYLRKTNKNLKILFPHDEIMKGPEALGKFGDLFGSDLISKTESDLLSFVNGKKIGSIIFGDKPDSERETEILSLIRNHAWEELFGISQSEHEFVEFKPSLIEIEYSNQQRSFEFECFKTIAAFLNTNGGALFIGIKDNGVVKGIEKSYLKLPSYRGIPYSVPSNQDGFRQIFDFLFKKYLGPEHFGKCTLQFWKKDRNDVAIVSVTERSNSPVYIKNFEDHKKHFFVRGSGTTRELFGDSLRRYLDENF